MGRRRGFAHDELRAAQAARFATQLASALQELRLTHKELARQLGVTHHTVDSWTRIADPMLPTEVNFERLATMLDRHQPGLGQRVAAAAGRTIATPPLLESYLPAGEHYSPEAPSSGSQAVGGAEKAERGPTNLHPALTNFVGREDQIREVRQLLEQTRLLTLTGAGGVGKTRLALEVAARALPQYAHGVWMVELEALTSDDLVAAAIAGVLGLREPPGMPLLQALTAYTRERHLLLVLDNCEHLIDTVAGVTESLLHDSPRLRILATSREALRSEGEMVWVVPSLTLPYTSPLLGLGDEGALLQSEAGRLFLARASAADPAFAMTAQNASDIAEICRQLDGIPLAIELAAAQVSALTVTQIAERLHSLFDVLTSGRRTALPRHRTLRACIDWSYELLSEDERRLLRRLGVFHDGWTLEAAETVCAGEDLSATQVLSLLSGLVHKSLVIAEDRGGRMRYRLLETVHQYALEQLMKSGEAETARARHAACFLALAEDPQHDWLYRSMSPERAQTLRAERANLRAAMDWSLAISSSASPVPSRNPEIGMRIIGALYSFWSNWDSLTEGEAWVTRCLAAGDSGESSAARAHALTVMALLYVQQGRFAEIRDALDRSVEMWRELRATGRAKDPASLARFGVTLSVRGTMRLNQGQTAKALADFEESVELSRAAGADLGRAMTLFVWADASVETDALDDVHARLEESARILGEVDPVLQIAPITTLGRVAWLEGDYATARARVESGLATRRATGGPWPLAGSLVFFSEILRAEGDYVAAEAHALEGLELYRQAGDASGMAKALYCLGLLAVSNGQYAEGQRQLCESLTLLRQQGRPPDVARCLAALAVAAQSLHQPEEAARLLGAAQAGLARLRNPWSPVDRAIIEDASRTVRTQLGEQRFAQVFEEGSAMGLGQAMDYALQSAAK